MVRLEFGTENEEKFDSAFLLASVLVKIQYYNTTICLIVIAIMSWQCMTMIVFDVVCFVHL